MISAWTVPERQEPVEDAVAHYLLHVLDEAEVEGVVAWLSVENGEDVPLGGGCSRLGLRWRCGGGLGRVGDHFECWGPGRVAYPEAVEKGLWDTDCEGPDVGVFIETLDCGCVEHGHLHGA